MIVLCRLFLLVLCVFTLNAVGIDFVEAATPENCAEAGESSCTLEGCFVDSSNYDACTACPSDYPLSAGNVTATTEAQACYKKETISLGTKFAYKGGTEIFECDESKNAVINEQGNACVCKDGYTQEDEGENATCEPKSKQIKLDKNCGIWAWNDMCIGTTSDLTLYLKYTGTWHNNAYDEASVDLGDLINKQVNTRKQFKLTGYYKGQGDSDTTALIQANGTFADGIDASYFFEHGISTVYAHWVPNFTITYKGNQSSETYTIRCNKDNDDTNCTIVMQYLDNWTAPKRKFFLNWECSDSSNKTVTIGGGGSISDLFKTLTESTISCKAVFGPCPANHYCVDGGRTPLSCPDGSKSAPGSGEITDCYVDSATVFEDAFGTFSLPISGQVHYVGK